MSARMSVPTQKAACLADEPDFLPKSVENAYPSLHRLLTMDAALFRSTYRGTPVVRAKRRGLARNAAVALGNVGTDDDRPILIRALREHDEPIVRGHAALGARPDRRGGSPWTAWDRRRGVEYDSTVLNEIDAALNSR